MVKTSSSNAGDAGSIPGWGAKISRASWPKNQKQKQYCNKFNKDFKNGPHQKHKNKKNSRKTQGQGMQSHKRPFEEIKGVPHRPQSNQKTSRKLKGTAPQPSQVRPRFRRVYLNNICGCSRCLMEGTTVITTQGLRSSWEIVSIEALPTRTARDQDVTTGGFQSPPPPIPPAIESRLIKLLGCKHRLLFMGKKGRTSTLREGPEPQRIIPKFET